MIAGFSGRGYSALCRAFFGLYPIRIWPRCDSTGYTRPDNTAAASYERGSSDAYYMRSRAPNRRLDALARHSFYLSPADAGHYLRGLMNEDDRKDWH